MEARLNDPKQADVKFMSAGRAFTILALVCLCWLVAWLAMISNLKTLIDFLGSDPLLGVLMGITFFGVPLISNVLVFMWVTRPMSNMSKGDNAEYLVLLLAVLFHLLSFLLALLIMIIGSGEGIKF